MFHCFHLNFFIGMTAIGLSPNRRYVAIAEKSEKPILTIYDLLHDQSKKRKVLFLRSTMYSLTRSLCNHQM